MALLVLLLTLNTHIQQKLSFGKQKFINTDSLLIELLGTWSKDLKEKNIIKKIIFSKHSSCYQEGIRSMLGFFYFLLLSFDKFFLIIY